MIVEEQISADLMSDYSARRATYVGAEPTGEREL
jgi:hypothetical protein